MAASRWPASRSSSCKPESYWMEGELELARRSLALLCERLRCLQMLRFTGQPLWAAKLQEKQREHHAAFSLSYGVSKCKPKHRYASHLPAQFHRDGYVLDTLCNEARHRAIKIMVETSVARLRDFEIDLLSRLAQYHLHVRKKRDLCIDHPLCRPARAPRGCCGPRPGLHGQRRELNC